MKKQDIKDYIAEGTLLEHLEEVGKVKVDFLDDEIDLDLLVEILEKDYNLFCELKSLVGGHYLVNVEMEAM